MRPESQTTREALDAIGERLRALRRGCGLTLAEAAAATRTSTSTLSRLESGQRRANLELLLPLASLYGVTLDGLVGNLESRGAPTQAYSARPAGDAVPRTLGCDPGSPAIELSREPGPLQAYKMVLPADRDRPDVRSHPGHEWLYVLSGSVRLIVGRHDLILRPGEAADFSTRVPHWFGTTGNGPAEIISLFGRRGEQIRLRASSTPRGDGLSVTASGG